MSPTDKPIVWLHGEVKSPPFSSAARVEAGYLLRLPQKGQSIGMPHSKPMQMIGRRCHELRVVDENKTWRIVYRIDDDAILILAVFAKKTSRTAKAVIDICKARARRYNDESK